MVEHIPFLDINTTHAELEEELLVVFKEALSSGRFIGGSMVEEFEKDFAAYCNSEYCVGVASGTDALRFSLIAAGVKKGDTVITVPNTFIATTEAISQVGAFIDFVDIDARTYNMDPEKLRKYLEVYCRIDNKTGKPINRKTGSPVTSVIPVHLYGQMADMDPIVELAEKYDLIIIEDACQAHGAEYFSKNKAHMMPSNTKDNENNPPESPHTPLWKRGARGDFKGGLGGFSNEGRWRKSGSIGKAAAFSFYPGKNLGACGEAGAVTTDDEEIAQKIRIIRDHGQAQKYFHDIEGYNGRLDAIQAGILRVKLRHLPEWNESRRQCTYRYNELLSDVAGIITPYEPPWVRAVYHLYVIRTNERDILQRYLSDNHVTTGLHYPVPLHLQKAYGSLRCKDEGFPITEKVALEILSLPMYPGLREDQQVYVAEKIKEWCKVLSLAQRA
jgi:dTDP-4-amino-4,6-dideoxygalactose transaminase